jgi:hypothetical protein
LLLPIASTLSIALFINLYYGTNVALVIVETSFLLSMPPYIVFAIILFWRFRGKLADVRGWCNRVDPTSSHNNRLQLIGLRILLESGKARIDPVPRQA